MSDATSENRGPPGWRVAPVRHILLLLIAVVVLLPFFWLICATLKGKDEFFSYSFLPWDKLNTVTLDNYRVLFTKEPFGRWLLNSIFLSSLHTVIVVSLSSLGGFALAKYQFRGKKIIMLLMLCTMLLPGQVLLPSMYRLIYQIGWVDTFAAIIVPGAVSVFGIFLFRGAFAAVPEELLQAGRVDGCSEFRLWWDIALPVVRPMIGAYTLLTFTGAWNSFLWPQIVLQDESRYTLPIGLASMIGIPEYETQYGILMAGTLLAVLPVMVLFFALQRDFVSGLTSGAVKG